MDIVKEISSNGTHFSADAGEPDTGHIKAGKLRILGIDDNKPEPWYESGGYTQLDFPEADHMRGKGVKPEFEVTKIIKERILKEGKRKT